MTTQMDKDNARLKGMKAYTDGHNFTSSPWQGFKEDDIELRWQWQKGWLRAQLEKEDAEKKTKPKDT